MIYPYIEYTYWYKYIRLENEILKWIQNIKKYFKNIFITHIWKLSFLKKNAH